MDNKRTGYDDPKTDAEAKLYFGDYYDEWKNCKRTVRYIFDDITIEEPCIRDFSHILMCMLNDEEGIFEEEFHHPESQNAIDKMKPEVMWFFTEYYYNQKQDIFLMYKDNEYAGFGTILKPTETSLPVVTQIIIREKFKKTLLYVCGVDFVTNMLYPDTLVLTDKFNVPFNELINITNPAQLLESLVDVSLGKEKFRVQKILQKYMDKNS